MYEKLLEECGLTKNESLVYMALLHMGKAKSGDIIRQAGVSGGKIYETLYKLIDKGLVKSVSENGIKHFIANDPRSVLLYVKEKEKILSEKQKELEKVLPSFNSIKKEVNSEAVSLIKGLRGISALVYDSLEKAKSIKVMGVKSSKDDKYNNFWRGWHRKRVELDKGALILFSDRNTDYWDFFKKLRKTKVKELLHPIPSAILIIDDDAFIFNYDKDILCIHISLSAVAKSFSNFFDDLWMLARA